MKYRQLKQKSVFSYFWFTPLMLSCFAIILAFTLLYLDKIDVKIPYKDLLKSFVGYEEVHSTLILIASSLMTITSVTFSITVLTLSIASTQLGPRLLPNFMQQRTTQFVLGIFIGTFIYILIVLHGASIQGQEANIPYLSITIGLILGSGCFLLLIYFINFVCHIIQIDNILRYIAADLYACITNNLHTLHEASPLDKAIEENIKKRPLVSYSEVTLLRSRRSGYIQSIDYQKLMSQASKKGMRIEILARVGDFIFHQYPLIRLHHNDEVDKNQENNFRQLIKVGEKRTTEQDIAFAFEEMAEIAVLAISPGINNPYTAVHSLNRIIESIEKLSHHRPLSSLMFDENSYPVLTRKVHSFNDYIEAAFQRFRQQAVEDFFVTLHLLKMITVLFSLKLTEDIRVALEIQANAIYEEMKNQHLNQSDSNQLSEVYQALIAIRRKSC